MIEFIVLIVIVVVILCVVMIIKKKPPIKQRSADGKTNENRMTPHAGVENENEKHERSPGDPEKCWVSRGREIVVENYKISGGMIYVGDHLAAIKRNEIEPALINPNLPVSSKTMDKKGASLSHWPSYSDISPGARAAYLQWLSDGRRDPSIGIGYVFLFFYGLERRALADAKSSIAAKSHIPAIIEEVQRLLSIYGSDNSFKNCANNFLDLVQAVYPKKQLYKSDPPWEGVSGAFPSRLKVGLGQLVVEGKPIPPDWMLAWVMLHPETRTRTPAKRCAEEMRMLFAERYREKCGEGVQIKPNKTMIRLEYHTSSASFGYKYLLFKAGLPDLTALKRPVNQFRDLFYECQNDLDPYSRLLGRNPDAEGSLAALATLPAELVKSKVGQEAADFYSWVSRELINSKSHDKNKGAPWAIVDAEKLIEYWPTENKAEMLKTEAVKLARLLEKWNLGVEPDPRFGGPTHKTGGKAVIFTLPVNTPAAASREYSAATTLMHLAAMVSAADGEVTEDERIHLKNHLKSALQLSHEEEMRLSAHVQWLLTSPPGLAGMKKRLEGVSEVERLNMGWFLITVAGADGVIHPDEIKILKKIYRTLGLDPDEIYNQVHRLTTGGPSADEPAAVMGPDASAGDSIPAGPAKPPPAKDMDQRVSLDMERVKLKMEETAKASAVLGKILAEEDYAVPPTRKEEETPAGLDASHTAMLRALAEQPSWSREAFESLALQFHLPPDGALEKINEAAWDIANQALFEVEDPIELDQDVLEKMLK